MDNSVMEERRIKINNIYSLIGTSELRYECSENEMSYPLRPITQKELIQIRASKTPGFVVKIGNRLFYTEIPEDANLHTSAKASTCHKCGQCNYCRKVDGKIVVCQKINDRSVHSHECDGYGIEDAVRMSKRIEKYDFIRFGYEAFNVIAEELTVANCIRFSHIENVPRKSVAELKGFSIPGYKKLF